MVFIGQIAMSIQDSAGNYFIGALLPDGTYSVSLVPGLEFLNNLPIGWDKTEIQYERNTNYMGIFRSMSSGSSYQFSGDGRAILQYLRKSGGLQAQGVLTTYIWNERTLNYDTFYASELDFKSYSDNVQDELCTIGTLDSGLFRDLQAYGDTQYNIPYFLNTGTNTAPVWQFDGSWILHPGIKLLYSASFTSSATDTDVLYYNFVNNTQLNGWNHGRGNGGGDGYHIIPAMNPFNITQNNGTTTFIGNDILQPFLIQTEQIPGAANFGSENTFNGVNHSQPFTKNQFAIKDLLPQTSIDMWVSMSVTFAPSTPGTTLPNVFLAYPASSDPYYMKFVLFEIDEKDSTPLFAGTNQYIDPQVVLDIPLPAGPQNTTVYMGTYDNTDNPMPITLNYGKCYVFGIICDRGTYGSSAGGIGSGMTVSFGLSNLNFTLKSRFDGGASGTPIAAPVFPASAFAGFRLFDALQRVVPNFATRNTNPYGFPIPVSTAYNGQSNFLSNPANVVGDVTPYNIMLSSAYAIHDLQGQSFMSVSFNALFDFCKKQLGCGAAIEGNTLRIEDLSYFFDNTTQILDLGDDIEGFTIKHLVEGVGSNLKIGYTAADINSDFGVDIVNTEQFFNTPLSNIPGTMDFEETSILLEQNAIEKIRAQKVSQPVGQAYNPANPSSDNQTVALYCEASTTGIGPTVYNPSNGQVAASYHKVKQYSNAQSTDPTAATAPYIYGLRYPDTAINLPLSGARCLERSTGAYIHSVLDKMDTQSLIFRNTYVMQYNNTVSGLTGIQSNLKVGAGSQPISEFADRLIGTLPAKLFQPVLFEFRSKYPVILYNLLNTRPNGFVRLVSRDSKTYQDKEYFGFIMRAKQSPAMGIATDWQLLATAFTNVDQ